MAAPPIRSSARSAYLISNAQVTGAARRVIRRPRRQVLVTMRRLVADGDAIATGPLRAVRPLAGQCLRPIKVEETGGTYNRPVLDTYVRCRKCEPCLIFKRKLWAARAHAEIAAHERTWMVTLTMTPAEHHRMLLLAHRTETRAGGNPGAWSADREFNERAAQFGKEVTKWLKRLRASGAAFHYLLVVEAHKSGLPHIHLLVHEVSGCSYRRLTSAWKLGFVHAKLVEGPSAARYVTKYLVKSSLARVRASQRYGSSAPLGPSVRDA